MKALVLFAAFLFFYPGCAHVISTEILREVDPAITFTRLRADPNGCAGRMVLLGGVIVTTTNEKNGTRLEIYQTAMNSRGKPVKRDQSLGRFRAFTPDFLESAIFGQGRSVTIAGIARGAEAGQLGESPYLFPSVEIRELYLWPLEPVRVYMPGYGPFWDPWWPSRYGPHSPWYPSNAPYPASRSRHHEAPRAP